MHSGVPGLWLTRSDGAPNSDSPHIIYSLRLHAVRTRGRPEASPSQDPERVIHRASGACGASKSTGLRRVGGSPSHIPVLDGSGEAAPWSYEGSPRRRTPTASARRTMRRLDSAGWERGAVDAPASPASPARAEPPRPSGAAPAEQHGRRQCGERYHPPGIPLRRRPPHPITTPPTTAPPSRTRRWAEGPRRRALGEEEPQGGGLTGERRAPTEGIGEGGTRRGGAGGRKGRPGGRTGGGWGKGGGANGTRTRNPLLAKQVRYQLRHGPCGAVI